MTQEGVITGKNFWGGGNLTGEFPGIDQSETLDIHIFW